MAEEKGCTMMARKRGAAIYVRVSTDKQTVENQVRELRQIAERRGWEVVEQYSDAGISGSKGRDRRPGLDLMLNDAKRRKFDVVMAWAIDRLGRSLVDLLHTIQELEAAGVDLYLDQQPLEQGKIVKATLKFDKATSERSSAFNNACCTYARVYMRKPGNMF
jgi:DNA invertase Pin-like site-specific DNA recombinase